ncbi:MAG: tetratricopeptide repeat protein [Candidatus Margulisiibacteriota bacterium]
MRTRGKEVLRYAVVLLGVLLVGSVASAFVSFKDIDPEGVSFQAGPTKGFEGLSIAWVETALYPKNVSQGRELFLEVNLTSKVQEIKASFDFDNKDITLYSDDGLSWSRVIKTPANILPGVHVAKLEIKDKKGNKIARTLDFLVKEDSSKDIKSKFTVKVLSEAPIIDNGKVVGQLEQGARVEALYKAPFYRIRLENGKEGWVEANNVEELTGELYLQGYKSYISKDYANAALAYKKVVDIDPLHFKAHYWLSKSYLKLGKVDLAIAHLNEVLAKNPEDIDAALLSAQLSERYAQLAQEKQNENNFAVAVDAFEKVVALEPEDINAWVSMGNLYKKMGSADKAQNAYLHALRVDPTNNTAHAAMNTKIYQMASAPRASAPIITASTAKKQPVIAHNVVKEEKFRKLAMFEEKRKTAPTSSGLAQLPKDMTASSINFVRTAKTHKGTNVNQAIASVLSMTRSLGTKIYEDGWHVRNNPGGGTHVIYVCRQERNGNIENENFEFRVNVDNGDIHPLNANAKLLMSRW